MKQTILSLILAASQSNLFYNTHGKTCTGYYLDFYAFVREILASSDYKRIISHPFKELDQISKAFIQLIHTFSYALFTQIGNEENWIDYICDLIKRGGGEPPSKKVLPLTLLSQILDFYDVIDNLLKLYPDGPLFKTLDIFASKGKKIAFDPFLQKNFSHQLYLFSAKSFQSIALKLPCPTNHQTINRAEITDEFKGYLRYLEAQKKTHLCFNLQQSTSWEEEARCKALEKLTKKFPQTFFLVTLPEKGDFYEQTGRYAETKDFLKILKEKKGGFFSQTLDSKKLESFEDKVLDFIHKELFKKTKIFSRKDRLDFIVIFHLFISLKVLDWTTPDYFSFSCKDGIDTGASFHALFFTLVKMLSKQEKWEVKEQKFLLFLLYGPALNVRERLIDSQRLNRIISALSILAHAFQSEPEKMKKKFATLYGAAFLKEIEVN